MQCPVCDAAGAELFLVREGVPVHQNLLLASREDAVAVGRGDLGLARCKRCGFVFNARFDTTKLAYGQYYDNTQECSAYFSSYMDALVERITGDCEGALRVVEVGCGKGGFLRRLVEEGDGRILAHGFDPSYDGPAEDNRGLLRFTRSFYGPESADEPADVVVCRHVIEHVQDPMALLRSIRTALAGSPSARLFLETPCVDWIIETGAVWDFFYEHCSYFNPGSMATALMRAGFQPQSILHGFGGQYLWVEASLAASAGVDTPVVLPESAASRVDPSWERGFLEPLRMRLAELESAQAVALWGAGAKGVTFANLLDPEATQFSCVVDLNQRKQGMFVAGTGHPIVDYRELPRLGVGLCLVMNPNYTEEIGVLLQTLDTPIALADITEGSSGS